VGLTAHALQPVGLRLVRVQNIYVSLTGCDTLKLDIIRNTRFAAYSRKQSNEHVENGVNRYVDLYCTVAKDQGTVLAEQSVEKRTWVEL
jgi:hypothetical protein